MDDETFDPSLVGFEDDGTDALVSDGSEAVSEDGLEIDEESPLLGAEELASRVRRLVELREQRDITKKASDKAKAEFEKYQEEFMEELARSPLKGSLKVDLGGDHGLVQIVPRKTHYGRILDRDKALEYLNERALTEEFTKSDFRMGRLHELVRECLEQKKPIPEGLDFYTKRYFTVTFKD